MCHIHMVTNHLFLGYPFLGQTQLGRNGHVTSGVSIAPHGGVEHLEIPELPKRSVRVMMFILSICIHTCTYFILLYHIISYYILLYYIMLYYLYHLILFYVTLYYIISYYIILCCIVLYYIIYIYECIHHCLPTRIRNEEADSAGSGHGHDWWRQTSQKGPNIYNEI